MGTDASAASTWARRSHSFIAHPQKCEDPSTALFGARSGRHMVSPASESARCGDSNIMKETPASCAQASPTISPRNRSAPRSASCCIPARYNRLDKWWYTAVVGMLAEPVFGEGKTNCDKREAARFPGPTGVSGARPCTYKRVPELRGNTATALRDAIMSAYRREMFSASIGMLTIAIPLSWDMAC